MVGTRPWSCFTPASTVMSDQQHQLAAILFTDIAGYTAMMQADERKAMELIRHYNQVLEPAMDRFHGKIANNYGDGSLCLFTSALDAVKAAISIQKGLQENPMVPLRIGLHIGEVFFEDGKVFGDGVNVASRVQSLGQPNTILLSRDIYDKIRNQTEFGSISLGQFAFKNVTDPLEVFALISPGLMVPDKKSLEGKLQERKKTTGKLLWPILVLAVLLGTFVIYNLVFKKSGFTGTEKSIAVIPFTNKDSLDKENEYLCEGVADNIAQLLSKVESVEVKAMNAAKAFQGSQKPSSEISAALNHPAALLRGSIGTLQKKIVIYVELLDVASDKIIWSNTYQYNKGGDDILSIPGSVAQLVAKGLDVTLNPLQKEKISKEPTKSKLAYEYYLKGKEFQNKWVLDDTSDRKAVEFYQEAIKIDSSFAAPWLGLAEIFNARSNGNAANLTESNKAVQAIYRVLKYDPENSDAHAIFGDILKKYTLNPSLSNGEFEEAIRLNPNNPKAYLYYSYALLEMHRYEEARKNIEKSLQLDPVRYNGPYDPWQDFANTTLDTAVLGGLLRKYEGTAYFWNDLNKRDLYHANNQYDSSLKWSIHLKDTIQIIVALLGLRQSDQARRIASAAIHNMEGQLNADNAYSIASIFALIGNKEKSLEYLDKALALRSYGLIGIRIDMPFDHMRKDPEFLAFMAKLGGN
jgi:adenylate cyclase